MKMYGTNLQKIKQKQQVGTYHVIALKTLTKYMVIN